MDHPLDPLVKATLEHIQSQFAAVRQHQLTHKEFAEIAGFEPRRIADWMRGTNKAQPMIAVLQLLSQLPEDRQREVLAQWKNEAAKSPSKPKPGKKK